MTATDMDAVVAARGTTTGVDHGTTVAAMAERKVPGVHDRLEDHSKVFRDLLLGFVRTHVLHHASREPVYGVGIIGELDRHGYRLSPGTIYPLLHNLEAAGFLQRDDQIVEGKIRKYYRITPVGRRVLRDARSKILELADEITQTGSNASTRTSKAAARRTPVRKTAGTARQR